MNQNPPPNTTTASVALSALTYGGSAIGEVISGQPEHMNKKVFVPFTIPGEQALVKIVGEEKRFLRGEALSIVKASPDRIIPPCPYFESCGGCDLQHMTITRQRSEKLQMVRDTLRIKAGIEPMNGIVLLGSDLPEFGYRVKISLHLTPHGEFGFYRRGTGEVVDIQSCLLANVGVNKLHAIIRDYRFSLAPHVAGIHLETSDAVSTIILKLRERGTEEALISDSSFESLVSRGFNVKITSDGECVYERGSSPQNGENLDNTSSAGHFSQVNEAGNKILIAQVLSLIDSGPVTEFFAGSGNFTLPLAHLDRKVSAIEIDSALVDLGRERVRNEKPTGKVTFFPMSCERYLRQNTPDPVVLLDPPRSGAREVSKSLKPETVRKIVYVSCNLPSLTRDLAQLLSQGYVVNKVFVLDMFPQTHHVETITELSVKPSSTA